MYEIEIIRKNYQQATVYMDEYVNMTDSIYGQERNTEIQQLINQFNTKIHIREEQIKNEREKRKKDN